MEAAPPAAGGASRAMPKSAIFTTQPGSDFDLNALKARVHEMHWLEHSFYGRFRPQPIFIEAEQRLSLERDLVGLLHLIRSVPERLFGNDVGRMCEAVGMGPLQRRAVLETWEDQDVFLSRADLYQDSTGFKVLEFNIVSALGGFETAEISRAMLAAPFLRRFVEEENLGFPETIDLFAAEIHRAARRRGLPELPRMVLVEWPQNMEKEGERMGYWAEAFSQRGFDASVCHSAQLSGEAGRLFFEGRPVDILYRYFLIEDLHVEVDGAEILKGVELAVNRGVDSAKPGQEWMMVPDGGDNLVRLTDGDGYTPAESGHGRLTITEVTKEIAAEVERAQELARRYEFDFVDLAEFRPDLELFRSIPLEYMVRYEFLPLEATDHQLVIAVADPTDLAKLDELEGKLDRLSTYGLLRDMRQDEITAYIKALIDAGCIAVEKGMYPTVSLTDFGREVMKSRAEVMLELPD